MTTTTQVEVRLPKLGESILTATVVKWMKEEGSLIAEDEPLLEVATDKVNSEIPSPVAGRLIKTVVEVDAEIEIGTVLALVEVGSVAGEESEPVYHSEQPHLPAQATTGFLSPAVLRLVRERGIRLSELEKISGSGDGGRITKRDIDTYLMAKGSSKPQPVAEAVKMSPMRKAIAENMSRSFYEAPHAYILTEVDVTNLVQTIAGAKADFLTTHGAKLTITSYLVRAIAHACSQCPLVNATVDGDAITTRKEVNVGIAVAIDDGLVVPVIKECQDRDIASIATTITDLSTRARSRQLKPNEVADGSITLTNFGMSGALMGMPIIRNPEVGIIGVGALLKRPVVQPDDSLAIRQILMATLSFDHRVIDGMYAGAFLAAFKESLES